MSILYSAPFLSLSKNDQFSAFHAIEGKTQEFTADRGLTHLFAHPLSHCIKIKVSWKLFSLMSTKGCNLVTQRALPCTFVVFQ